MLMEKINLILDFIKTHTEYTTGQTTNIDSMSGQEFEKYCASLLSSYGFVNIEITKGSGDQGVDITGYINNVKCAIQCKRHSKKLSNKPIQEVFTGKNYYNCQSAIVITNNYFTNGAIELAETNDVTLWDRDNLLQLINLYNKQWDELLKEIEI